MAFLKTGDGGNGGSSGGEVSVTSDGSKTYAQLFDALYALIDVSKITPRSYLMINQYIYKCTGNFQFSRAIVGGTPIHIEVITATLGVSSTFIAGSVTSGGTTFETRSNVVAPQGNTFKLCY